MSARLVSSVVLCSALSACTGVLLEPGNAFPCDFSRPAGERDDACSPGDVCGVDNRCQRFSYEGPQFEGLPTFPDFSPAAGAGTVLHPRALKGPVDAVVAQSGAYRLFAHTAEGFFELRTTGAIKRDDLAVFNPSQFADLAILGEQNSSQAFARRVSGLNADVFVAGNALGGVVEVPGQGVRERAASLRVLAPDRLGAIAMATDRSSVFGLINRTPLAFTRRPDVPFALDVVSRWRTPGRPVVVLSTDGLRAELPDGGFQLVVPGTFPPESQLGIDETGTVLAVMSSLPLNLSTAVLKRAGLDVEVSRAWDDCKPCLAPRAFTPGLDGTGPFVDVLCADSVQRIRDAKATGECSVEPLEQPFDVAQLNQLPRVGRPVVRDTSAPYGFLAGGTNGQVWGGRTIGSAAPLFLDRVPVDVGTIGVRDGGSSVFALTNAGLFTDLPGTGYVVVAPDLTSRFEAIVGEGQGWTVAEGGLLVKVVNLDGGVAGLGFGPRLVDGRGQPVTRPLRGEAFTALDGGLVSMLIAADDSLYFVPAPTPTLLAGQVEDLSPALTPEPSSFIRSLALERAPTGTNGVDRVRGYVVTSRNVFEVKLGGAPVRWTAKSLPLSGAEPVEVWFDNPRGGLGRVGYRDGTVFSIPGGYQLTEALPGSGGGTPVVVRDYENLGGWPVALTETGLFIARYDALPSGRLDNRFADGRPNKPMSWREVTLPDGSKPWVSSGRRVGGQVGRLFVLAEPQVAVMVDGKVAYQRTFRLFIFLPTKVLELGRHVRSNASAL